MIRQSDSSSCRSRATLAPGYVLLALMTAACAGDVAEKGATIDAVRRDSAGIEIVENPAPRAAQFAFLVDTAPAVDIGMRAGPPEYLLAGVMGVARLRDGRIVVAERDAQLRYFDSTGKHDTTLSRRGEGPGEVTGIRKFLPYAGDSLLVLWGGGGSSTAAGPSMFVEATVFDASGRFGRHTQLRLAIPSAVYSSNIGIEAVTDDGRFLIRRFQSPVLQGSRGTRWSMEPYVLLSADGSTVDTIAVLPTADVEEIPGAGRGYLEDRPSLARNYVIPFFRRKAPPPALHDSWMYWGNGDRFEIKVFEFTRTSAIQAKPTRIIRYALANPAVDNAVRDRYLGLMLDSSKSAADSLAHRQSRKERPARHTLPAFQTLIVDGDGNLWVEHLRLRTLAVHAEDPNEPNIWTVFDSSGALVGDVRTPSALRITQIGRHWIMGIWADADGVQHVRVHRFRIAGR